MFLLSALHPLSHFLISLICFLSLQTHVSSSKAGAACHDVMEWVELGATLHMPQSDLDNIDCHEEDPARCRQELFKVFTCVCTLKVMYIMLHKRAEIMRKQTVTGFKAITAQHFTTIIICVFSMYFRTYKSVLGVEQPWRLRTMHR